MTANPKFDPEAGEQAKQDGMAAAKRKSDPDAYQKYKEVLLDLFRRRPYVMADDLEEERQRKYPFAVLGNTRNAVGSMFTEAARDGWCVETIEHFKSRQVQNRSRLQKMWKSLLYTGPILAPKNRRPRKPLRKNPKQGDLGGGKW